MANDTSNWTDTLPSTLAYGLLGAGLVYLVRRCQPGILTALATTAGYSLITKAVSSTVLTALKATEG